MLPEKLIPGADEWWNRWRAIAEGLVARYGFQVGVLHWFMIDKMRAELLDLLESAATKPEFWARARQECDRVFKDADALRELLANARRGAFLMPDEQDVPEDKDRPN